jgi:hypothetical protein
MPHNILRFGTLYAEQPVERRAKIVNDDTRSVWKKPIVALDKTLKHLTDKLLNFERYLR